MVLKCLGTEVSWSRNVSLPKKHVIHGELFPQNGSKMYQNIMVLLHEFEDNVAVVATTVASITTGSVQFQTK